MASCKPPAADAAAGRRRHSRLRVDLPARLITLEGTFPATLLNLSFRGGKVFLGQTSIRPGANAVLCWGGFEAFCTVAWSQDGNCGLDFDEPLKPHMLIETRDLADSSPRVDTSRTAAQDWVIGRTKL